MSYQWTITVLDNRPADIVGPSTATMTPEEIMNHPERVFFQMRDADRELQAMGYFIGEWDSEDGFGPLDDYGVSIGCVDIEYQIDKKWILL